MMRGSPKYMKWIAALARRTPEQIRITTQKRVASWRSTFQKEGNRESHVQRVIAAHARKTPEQRAAENKKHRETCAAWTDEQKAARSANIKAGILRRTQESREAAAAKRSATWSKKSAAEIEERTQKYLGTMAAKPPEELEARKRKISETKQNWTPEQKRAVTDKYFEAMDKKATEKANNLRSKFEKGELTAEQQWRLIKNAKGSEKDRASRGGRPNQAMSDLCRDVEKSFREKGLRGRPSSSSSSKKRSG
jgi:hypothetical protein